LAYIEERNNAEILTEDPEGKRRNHLEDLNKDGRITYENRSYVRCEAVISYTWLSAGSSSKFFSTYECPD
jgi:hypothetical protein